MVETYPESLRERLMELGAGFAECCIANRQRRSPGRSQALGPFVEKDDVVRFEERGRRLLQARFLLRLPISCISEILLDTNVSETTIPPS